MFGKIFAKLLHKMLDKFMTKFFGEDWYQQMLDGLSQQGGGRGGFPHLGGGGGPRPTSEEIKEQLDTAKKNFPRMYRWTNKLCEKFTKKSLDEMTHQACGVEYPDNMKHADTQGFEPGTEPANEQEAEKMVDAACEAEGDDAAMEAAQEAASLPTPKPDDHADPVATAAADRAKALPPPRPGGSPTAQKPVVNVTRIVMVPSVVAADCEDHDLHRKNDSRERAAPELGR